MYKIGLGSGSSSSYRGWFLGLVLSISFFQNSEPEIQGPGIGPRAELKTGPKTKTWQY